ncbi:MAG: heavy metal translocating P-type ATPase metal-binding domain-containing protein [Cyclobacteriaceae bacterium]
MEKANQLIDQKIETTCFHCGECCVEQTLHHDGKVFCCNGCQLVYDVLEENDLCDYYEIAPNPGNNQKKSSERKNRFDYLADPEVTSKLLDFQDPEESHVTFYIPLIHCASCIWLLENLHQLDQAITSSRVNFLQKKVQIKFKNKSLDLKGLVTLLAKIGYEPAINLSDVDKRKILSTDRKLIYKLAVAGFCFGNMMFFSLPEYFSEAELLGEGFRKLFNYLNVLLALPVFFYSATDYYRSAWLAIKSKAVNMDVPIALGIITLFSYSMFEIFVSGQEGYLDSMGGLLFFLLLGKLYQKKTYETLSFSRDYTSYFPIAVTKMVRDREEVIPLTKLQVGEIIKVRNEELIPADSVLLEGQARIDYSFVTGEEVPVPKTKGELIFAGGRQKGQPITLVVQKPPSQGYLTDLWNNTAFVKADKETSLASLADQISGKFTFTVLFIAFAALVYWSFQDFSMGIKAFTAVLIITCPCALAMSTPFTLGNTLRIFGQSKFYLKNAHVVEKMAKVDTVVFDKTGTLTAPSQAHITFRGGSLSTETTSILKGMVQHSVHPLSYRINGWLGNIPVAFLEGVEEVPGKGIKAIYKSQLFLLGSASFTGAKIKGDAQIPGNQVFFSVEGILMGYFQIESGLRKGMDQVVCQLINGRQVHLLSGDNDLEREQFEDLLGPEVTLKFNQSPQDKLDYIQRLKAHGGNVLMVGDGLNDAGALKVSQVGIAVTENISHFSPSSDAILDAEKLYQLPQYLRFSQTSRKIIQASFALSFTYNAIGIFFAVQGLVSPVLCAILMPLSSISVVLFTTLGTNYFAYKKGLKEKIC